MTLKTLITASAVAALALVSVAASAADVQVTCEKRSNRSRASVDGENLKRGSYRAVLTSGGRVSRSNFDQTVGYLALRYGAEEVDRAAKIAGREILLASIISFIGIALVAPLALIVVIRRFERDLRALEAAASHLEDRTQAPVPTGSAFDSAIGNLRTSLRDANMSLDDLRAKLDSVPP